MIQSLKRLWKNYKYRFVPWISLNIIREERKRLLKIEKKPTKVKYYQSDQESIKQLDSIRIDHVMKDDVLISNKELRCTLVEFFGKLSSPKSSNYTMEDVHEKNSSIFYEHFGFLLGRRKSIISSQAGLGVFVIEGTVKAGSLVGKLSDSFL